MIRRILNLLSKQQKRQSIWIIVSMLARSILDFAGVAALIPVIFVLADRLGNDRRLVLLLCCGVIVFVLLKNCIILLLSRFQTKFQLDIYKNFSRRLFINYYNSGLLFLKKNSSVQLAYEVNGVCLTFSQNVLGSLFRIVGEVFLILLMVVALIIWKPMMGLLTSVLFIPVAAIYAVTVKKRVRTIGARSLQALRAQSRTVSEAFRGFTELEIANAFGTSLSNFDDNQNTIIHNRRSMEIYQLFPFFLSEMAVVAGLMILASFGGDDLMLTGGVFAIAAFRIIPAIRGVMNNYTILQNNINSVDVIEKGIRDTGISGIKDNDSADTGIEGGMEFEKEISGKNLSFAFPDGKTLFENFDLTIRKGERIGIRGRSGSGKSTLFNILLGFFSPTQGKIMIDDVELNEKNRRAWHKTVGYVPQEIFIIKGSLAENIALGAESIDREKVRKVLEQVSLKEWADDLSNGLDTELGEFGSRLSG